jgi:hypothetical protein
LPPPGNWNFPSVWVGPFIAAALVFSAAAIPNKKTLFSTWAIARSQEEGLLQGAASGSHAAGGINGLDSDRRRGRFRTRFAMNGIEDFLPVHGNLFGSNNPQPDFVAPDFHHRYGDIVVDDNTFVFFPGQH